MLTRDKELTKACLELEGVQCHNDLASLFQSEPIASMLPATRALVFCRDKAAELEEKMKPALCEAVVGQDVGPIGPPGYGYVGDVTSYGYVQHIDLQLDDMQAIADDAVNVPLWVTISGNHARLLVEKSDYYSLPSDEAAKFQVVGSARSDRYLLLDTEVAVEMWALVTVEVKQVVSDKFLFGAVEVSETDDPAVVVDSPNSSCSSVLSKG